MSSNPNISREQLQEILLKWDGSFAMLRSAAESYGVSSDHELAVALSSLLNLPFVEIPDDFRIERAIIQTVPEQLARRYTLVPFELENTHTLTVVMANPLDLDAVDTIRSLTKLEVRKAVGVEENILEVINKSYKADAYIEENLQDIASLEDIHLEIDAGSRVEIDQLKDQANDAPVIRFVNLLLLGALRDRASDIHFEPAEKTVVVRFRIDGVLREVTPPPRSLYAAVATRIKILSELDISEHRLPQDGRFKFKARGRVIDVRVSVLPVAYGEKIVLRILDRTALLVDMKDVGFDPEMLREFQRVLQRPTGIILVTGPTGSGKTSTLYSALNFLKSSEKNLQTVEDPIEYLIDGVNQTQIHPKIDLDFANCLRSILRQDPDIIMIGEIRDLETARIATRSSLTGHLVLSTLHTNDAPSSFSRLRDIGVEPYLISATVKLVIAQRLVRVICQKCKQPIVPEPDQLALAVQVCPDAKNWDYQAGAGCSECQHTGFRGRTGIFEFLEVSDRIREMVSERAGDLELRNYALSHGMESLMYSGLMKVKAGITTIDEVLQVAEQT